MMIKYVEFFDTRSGQKKRLGEIRLQHSKLELSDDLAPHWPRQSSYDLLGSGGYETMYDPEKILEALPEKFNRPEFQASEVKYR